MVKYIGIAFLVSFCVAGCSGSAPREDVEAEASELKAAIVKKPPTTVKAPGGLVAKPKQAKAIALSDKDGKDDNDDTGGGGDEGGGAQTCREGGNCEVMLTVSSPDGSARTATCYGTYDKECECQYSMQDCVWDDDDASGGNPGGGGGPRIVTPLGR